MDLVLALGDTGLVKDDLGLRLYREDERQLDLEALVVVVENPLHLGDYIVTVPDDFSWYTLTADYPPGVGTAYRFGAYLNRLAAPPNYILPLRETGLTVDDLGLALYLDGDDVTSSYTLTSTDLGNGDYSITGWPTAVSGRWLLRAQVGGLTFTHDWTVPAATTSDFLLEFADFFLDTVFAHPGVLDKYGAFTASGATINLPCRIEGEQRLVRDPSGQEVTTTVLVIVGGYYGLTTDLHRYTLPSRFVPNEGLRAVYVDKVSSDESETEYEEIGFQ